MTMLKVGATAEAPKKPKAKKQTPLEKERATAKACGLSLVHYRLLKVMADGKSKTYEDFKKKTGYYSTLTAALRVKHEGSLCHQKLAKETEKDGKLAFEITEKGKKALAKS